MNAHAKTILCFVVMAAIIGLVIKYPAIIAVVAVLAIGSIIAFIVSYFLYAVYVTIYANFKAQEKKKPRSTTVASKPRKIKRVEEPVFEIEPL